MPGTAFLLAHNRVAESEAEHQKFEAFLPFIAGSGLVQHFYFTGQYDRAVDYINRKMETNPNSSVLHGWLGLTYEQQGRTREAIEEFQKAISLSQGIDRCDAQKFSTVIQSPINCHSASVAFRRLSPQDGG